MTGKRSVKKAACKRLAAELRAEIGLEPMDALDPWALAELYGITVLAVSALPLTSEIAITSPLAGQRCSLVPWCPFGRAR